MGCRKDSRSSTTPPLLDIPHRRRWPYPKIAGQGVVYEGLLTMLRRVDVEVEAIFALISHKREQTANLGYAAPGHPEGGCRLVADVGGDLGTGGAHGGGGPHPRPRRRSPRRREPVRPDGRRGIRHSQVHLKQHRKGYFKG